MVVVAVVVVVAAVVVAPANVVVIVVMVLLSGVGDDTPTSNITPIGFVSDTVTFSAAIDGSTWRRTWLGTPLRSTRSGLRASGLLKAEASASSPTRQRATVLSVIGLDVVARGSQ